MIGLYSEIFHCENNVKQIEKKHSNSNKLYWYDRAEIYIAKAGQKKISNTPRKVISTALLKVKSWLLRPCWST